MQNLARVALALAPLITSSAMAASGADNFNDNTVNPLFWVVESAGGPTVNEVFGRVVMTLPNTSSGAHFYARYAGVPLLVGDFDVRVDYRLETWPTWSGVRVGLSVGTPNGGATVERLNFAYGHPEQYLVDFGSWWNGFNTNDRAGKLRMTRQGSLLTAWAWTQGAWVNVGFWGSASTQDATFAIWTWSHDSFFGDQETVISFDNFVAIDATSQALTGTLTLQDTVTPLAVPRFMEGTILQGSTILGKIYVEADGSNTWWCTTLPPTVSGPAIIQWEGSTFLTRRQPVNLTGVSQDFGVTFMVNGDVDNSGEVDAADIDLVIADFGDVSVGNSDVDVSGEVDAADIDIVIANFGAVDE
jgi:hypothetical protein